jgi:hypothetical protein
MKKENKPKAKPIKNGESLKIKGTLDEVLKVSVPKPKDKKSE